MVAIKSKHSYLGDFFRRLAARRGGKRALVAVIHQLAIAIAIALRRVLRDRTRYANSATTTSPDEIPNAPWAACSGKPTAWA